MSFIDIGASLKTPPSQERGKRVRRAQKRKENLQRRGTENTRWGENTITKHKKKITERGQLGGDGREREREVGWRW
jgi:hypothetical protein